MEKFKLTLFENDHKEAFPFYRKLSEVECDILTKSIKLKYELQTDNIAVKLSSKQVFDNRFDALQQFKLIETLSCLDIEPKNDVYVNWNNFNHIDVFKINDLDKYFDDIWFPSSDDIDIFDESLNWILSIRHDGVVSYFKTNQ